MATKLLRSLMIGYAAVFLFTLGTGYTEINTVEDFLALFAVPVVVPVPTLVVTAIAMLGFLAAEEE